MKVLVTGGAGYIGSITAKALEEAGHTPVILDSLLSGPLAFVEERIFYEGDIADRGLLRRVVAEHPDLDATIHMAARIVVPESVEKPYEYYRDNVSKSLELFDELQVLGKHRVLFSSSASLYAVKHDFEVTEEDPLEPASPYARTKRMMEQVLVDMAAATELRAIILRYFNPIGSDPDLETGIYAKEPSHVVGQLVMAARGLKDSFSITGVDHPTHLVIDLDPPDTEAFPRTVRTAQLVRRALADAGLAGAVKTSGAKGLHVFVPLHGRVTVTDAAAATRAIAARTERIDPDVATTAYIREDRGGKVFVDSTRSGRATVVAAYGPRARPGLPVSFPVAWDELENVVPGDFTVRTAPRLLAATDPWRTGMPPPQSLPADLVEEGHTIPVARVRAMHEGKRRARARRQ